MLAITLQDLRFRARRFLIASIGAALVFAMTLLLSGLAAGFSVEINRTVHALGAQSWVVAAGASGRMVSLSPLSAAVVPQVAADPGAGRVGPVVIAPQVAEVNGAQKSANLIGFIPGDLGAPPIVSGRQVASNGEAVVDTRLKLGVGRQFTMNGHHFTVVGTAQRSHLAQWRSQRLRHVARRPSGGVRRACDCECGAHRWGAAHRAGGHGRIHQQTD